jgi:hypothetical protein
MHGAGEDSSLLGGQAAVRDDAEVITRHRFGADELEAVPAMVVVGSGVTELLAAVAGRLGDLMGRPVWTVPGIDDHEIYLHQPELLAEAVAARLPLREELTLTGASLPPPP